MNKYYTPEIQEFHVGFECEFKNKMQDNVWNPEVCDQDTLNIAFHVYEENDFYDKFEDNFRVKHLDREDIEKCGWDNSGLHYSKGSFKMVESVDLITGRDYCYRIMDEKRSETVFNNTVFWGEIKNISELRFIMKCLGI